MKAHGSWWKVAAGTVVGLALVAAVAVLVAQTAAAQTGDQTESATAGPGMVEPGIGSPGMGGPRIGGPGDSGIDRQALLAEALGITTAELQAAQDKADRAAIEMMEENGSITAEQADLMLAQLALRPYLDRDKLTAAALGMTVEELKAAREAGKTERDLLDEKGIDFETFQENLTAARDKAIDQAVTDGVITAEQATALKEAGVGEGPGGHGAGGRGPGGWGRQGVPPSGDDSGTGSGAAEDTAGTGSASASSAYGGQA